MLEFSKEEINLIYWLAETVKATWYHSDKLMAMPDKDRHEKTITTIMEKLNKY